MNVFLPRLNFLFRKRLTFFLALTAVVNVVFSQTTVTVGGGASVTCPAVPTATWTTPPSGVTFSNWSRGSGVTCASAGDGISGSGFNSASASAGFTANAYYKVTITAGASTNFTLSSITWLATVSGTATANFTIQYSNNGGTVTNFGTAGQSGTGSSISLTFTPTTPISVAAGTAIDIFLIPHQATAGTTTVRFKNGSTFIVTATSAVTPVLTPSPASLTGLTYVQGAGPSTASSFTLAGSNLTAGGGTITISGSTNYEVSTSSATTGFSSSATLSYTGTGAFASNTVWVRLKAGLSTGSYNSETISISGGGASSSVTASGSVTAPAPSNDLCSNAVALVLDASSINGTLASATFSSPFTASNDVWYKFTPTSNNTYKFIVAGFSGDVDIELYSNSNSCPTSTTFIANSNGSTTTETINQSLTAGTTYYLRVLAFNTAANSTTFTAQVQTVADYISLTSRGNVYTENFDGMGTDAPAVIPTGFGIQDGNTSTMALTAAQQASSGTPTTGAAYNWGQSTTERALGLMYSGSYSSKSVIVKVRNNTGGSASSFVIGFTYEQYRKNTATQTFKLQYSTSLTTGWIDVGSGGFTQLETGTNTYGFTTLIASQSILLIYAPSVAVANGNDVYFRWILDGSTNSNGVGIDNFSIVVPNDQATADFKTSGAGNFSMVANWQYNSYGNNFVPASQLPGSTNSVTILHMITLDQDFTVGSGKTLTLDPSLTGADTFNIASTSVLTVSGTANFNSKPVAFKSDINGTARLAAVTGSLNGGDNVTVEQYIPAKRAWRHLSGVTVGGNQTINAAWQEEQTNPDRTTFTNNQPGYGTQITGSGGATNGFDPTGTNNGSLETWTPSPNNGWVYASNTTGLVRSSKTGYAMLIRGSRAYNLAASPAPAADITTLRATGSINTGNTGLAAQSFSSINSGDFIMVGNPYISPVDFANAAVGKTNIDSKIWFWDPKLSGVGGYVVMDLANPGLSTGVGVGGSFSSYTSVIPTGSAVLLKSTGTTAAVVFSENAKTSFLGNVNKTGALKIKPLMKFSITLQSQVNADSVLVLDNVVAGYGKSFSAAITNEDASKLENINENVALIRSGINLAIEKRPNFKKSDTLFLNIFYTKQQAYQFKISTENIPLGKGLVTVLEDQYLKTSTNLPINGITVVPFSVTADAASTGADRFRIVFKVSKTGAIAGRGSSNSISAYPNPVPVGSQVKVLFSKLNPGKYSIQVYNDKGALIMSKTVQHTGGDAYYVLPVNSSIIPGSYRINVIGKNLKTVQRASIIITK